LACCDLLNVGHRARYDLVKPTTAIDDELVASVVDRVGFQRVGVKADI
jgi:hypothetical protein